MKIQSDNTATEKALTKLVKTMQENGAWFHDDITLASENNGLRVELNGSCNPTEVIMRVPTNQLVPVAPLNMHMQGDDFAIKPDEKGITKLQVELGEIQVEIFNLTGRPAFHRNECVWIRYRDNSELLEMLLKARTMVDSQKKRLKYTKRKEGCEDDGTFLCDTFWQSRVLGHRDGPDDSPRQKVMPFVDYLDHHHQGSPFITPQKKGQENTLRIQNQRPFMGNTTLFACYGMYDALDTFITYGFIDTETPFVRAVPMDIPLDDKTYLKINSLTAAKAKTALNKHLKDVQKYSPIVNRDNEGNLLVSHLQINVLHAPNAMRRILRALIHTALNNAAPQYVVDLTYKVEKQIVDNTIDFYQTTLAAYEKMTDVPEDLRRDGMTLCKVQLAKLYKYFYNENFFAMKAPSEAENMPEEAMAMERG